MSRAFCIAALLVSLPVSASPARADSASCADTHKEGQRSLQGGLLIQARAAFLRCSQDDCPLPIRQACVSQRAELEASSASLMVSVVDAGGQRVPDAVVELASGSGPASADGHSLRVEPGPQVLLVSAPGRRSARVAIRVLEGERDRAVRVVLAPTVHSWLDVSTPRPGPNNVVTLTLGPGPQRASEHVRRLKLATYGLAVTGVAIGGWALASGLRGRQIDDACASQESCSEARAAHGRMLYRSADAGAAIGGVCGIGAAILLLRWLTASPAESANARERGPLGKPPTSAWRFAF